VHHLARECGYTPAMVGELTPRQASAILSARDSGPPPGTMPPLPPGLLPPMGATGATLPQPPARPAPPPSRRR
jgi:hypothetical protein